ncbi:MAG: Yip1 family protein [Caulobacteraceae bacterium]
MSTDVLDGERPGLFARVRNILFRPQSEWQRIAAEDPSPLIASYVAPLAIAGAIAGLAANVLYNGLSLDAALIWKAISALLYIVFTILGVIVFAMVINFLARRFGAEPDTDRAKRLAAYSATPILIAAFCALAPPLAAIASASGVVYALILLGIGVGRLLPLPDPENNVPRFTLTFAVIAAGLAALAAAFIGPLVNSGREALTGAVEAAAPERPAPVIANRPAAEVAIERLAQADGAHVLTDPARLEEQFPDSLPGGFARQSVATARGGGVSRADATYAQSGATLKIAIIQFAYNVDSSGAAALLDISEEGARANGYARSQSIDGRFFAEQVDGDNARYIVIGRGVAMIAEGRVTMDQARAATETIDLQRLEAAFGR